MNDKLDAEIRQEIEKISKDVKAVMKKVEALYPKHKAEETADDAAHSDENKVVDKDTSTSTSKGH